MTEFDIAMELEEIKHIAAQTRSMVRMLHYFVWMASFSLFVLAVVLRFVLFPS